MNNQRHDLITILTLIPTILGSGVLTGLISPLFIILGVAALFYFVKVYSRYFGYQNTDTASITISATDITTKD